MSTLPRSSQPGHRGPVGTLPPPCGEADPTCASLSVQQTRNIDFTGPVATSLDCATHDTILQKRTTVDVIANLLGP